MKAFDKNGALLKKESSQALTLNRCLLVIHLTLTARPLRRLRRRMQPAETDFKQRAEGTGPANGAAHSRAEHTAGCPIYIMRAEQSG
jgi:hypothetical protein